MRAEVVAAAKWWADQIRNGAKQDNGDVVQSAMAKWVGAHHAPPAPEAIDLFEKNLAEAMEAKIASGGWDWDESNPSLGSHSRTVDLKVDYDPSVFLYSTAEAAGIRVYFCHTFPMKTVMWCEPGVVQVRCGYGAGQEIIYGEACSDD